MSTFDPAAALEQLLAEYSQRAAAIRRDLAQALAAAF